MAIWNELFNFNLYFFSFTNFKIRFFTFTLVNLAPQNAKFIHFGRFEITVKPTRIYLCRFLVNFGDMESFLMKVIMFEASYLNLKNELPSILDSVMKIPVQVIDQVWITLHLFVLDDSFKAFFTKHAF